MKKLIITACLLLIALTACTNKAADRVEQTKGVDKVLSEMTGEATEIQIQESTEADTEGITPITGEADQKPVDIDLTVMDKDMTYATVFQLMVDSGTYIGKTIRVKGNYNPNWYEPTQKYYHSVIIQDATACCAQGLEFVWDDGSHAYPDDYPQEGDEIVVTVTFETYREEGILYCRLADAELELS